jgi:hypothetical protein
MSGNPGVPRASPALLRRQNRGFSNRHAGPSIIVFRTVRPKSPDTPPPMSEMSGHRPPAGPTAPPRLAQGAPKTRAGTFDPLPLSECPDGESRPAGAWQARPPIGGRFRHLRKPQNPTLSHSEHMACTPCGRRLFLFSGRAPKVPSCNGQQNGSTSGFALVVSPGLCGRGISGSNAAPQCAR